MALVSCSDEEGRVLGRTRRSQHPSKGFKLAEQREQEVGKETEFAAIPATEFRYMHTLSAALGLLDARPARPGVHLGGRRLLVFSEASLVHPVSPTSSWSRATPVLASVCVERRAAAFSEHPCSSAGSTCPSQCGASHCTPQLVRCPVLQYWHRTAIKVSADRLRLPALGTGPRIRKVLLALLGSNRYSS